MIFEFTDQLKESVINELNLDNYIVAYISASEFEMFYKNFGLDEEAFRIFTHDDRYFRSKIEAHDYFSFGTLRIIEPEVNNKDEIRLSFYITQKVILFIESSDTSHTMHSRFLEAVGRFNASEFMPEKLIFAFIDSIISCDNKALEDIELEISRIEDRIINEKEYKNFNEEILAYKRKLMRLRNFYEQLIDIGEALIENENNLFDRHNLTYFKIFIKKSERLCNNVNLLRENLMQVRETYQSNLDLKLNNTMKLFTVLTAVFSPPMLIAGWYGMNFDYMPELKWRYGYVYVIMLSITVLVVCIIVFKRKKLI